MKNPASYLETAGNTFEAVRAIVPELRRELRAGYEVFMGNAERVADYERVFDMLEAGGFVESGYDGAGTTDRRDLHERVPNPANHLAAQEIGGPLLARLADYSLQPGGTKVYPGDFLVSREAVVGEQHARSFPVPLIYRGKRIAQMISTFTHLHDGFGFPEAPQLHVAEPDEFDTQWEDPEYRKALLTSND